LLWRIARSAAELLTDDQLARVKLCAMPDCGWLFLDDSRAGNRRWCSMETCGNRHKARRHYRRHKPGESIGGTQLDGGERSSP
jgi:predicted RNA-binding Zn ribbon-like protein